MMREKLLLRQLEVINTTRKQQQQAGKRENDIDAGVEFLCENEEELLAAIRNFGRYQLTNLNLAIQDVYLKNEDYIKPSDDHETMFKGLNESTEQDDENVALQQEEGKESIVVDFSRHKSLMEHNAKLMNESIINITLKEAKELIRQAKLKREQPVPPLNLEELDDEVESSIAEVVSSLEQGSLDLTDQLSNNKYSQTQQQTTTKQKRFKPKITINNCNGTINLRNIASLTINCTTEDKVQAQIPVNYPNPEYEAEDEEASSSLTHKQTQKSKTLVESLVSSSTNTECTTPTSTSNSNTPKSLSNYSSNNSSRSQSTKKTKTKKFQTKTEKTQNLGNKIEQPQNNIKAESSSSSMANEVTCDFYNRLLNEIKKSINQQQKVRSKYTASNVTNSQQNADSAADYMTSSTTNSQPSRRLVLKNFENLRIILEANSSGDEDSFHPVQIEQWLAEIITDTDLEPMQNTDILEHSKIFSQETQET